MVRGRVTYIPRDLEKQIQRIRNEDGVCGQAEALKRIAREWEKSREELRRKRSLK